MKALSILARPRVAASAVAVLAAIAAALGFTIRPDLAAALSDLASATVEAAVN